MSSLRLYWVAWRNKKGKLASDFHFCEIFTKKIKKIKKKYLRENYEKILKVVIRKYDLKILSGQNWLILVTIYCDHTETVKFHINENSSSRISKENGVPEIKVDSEIESDDELDQDFLK